MKTILITGANGQLGNEMRVLSTEYPQFEYIFTDVEELDLTDADALAEFFDAVKVDFIVNCAAYTAVDKAEEDEQTAYKINAQAVVNLAEMAKHHNIKMLHVSTDYVFDGTSHIPYTEDMPASPNTIYGKTKLAGERLLLDLLPDAAIIRTSWLYSSFGNNFVKTMLKLGRERDSLNVVFDQIGTPTYAADLASAIMQIIVSQKFIGGIYHFSDEGAISWYDFTKAIHRLAGIQCAVRAVETSEYPTNTSRPHYSVLNKKKIKATYNIEIPYWEDSLRACLAKLNECQT